jgi:hypothetical protein
MLLRIGQWFMVRERNIMPTSKEKEHGLPLGAVLRDLALLRASGVDLSSLVPCTGECSDGVIEGSGEGISGRDARLTRVVRNKNRLSLSKFW